MTRIWTAVVLSVFGLAAASAEVPQLLNYQGKLTDSRGRPVDGSKRMTFEFYDDPVEGHLLEGFSERQEVVVAKGIFNVLIGSATEGGVPASVFDNRPSISASGSRASSCPRGNASSPSHMRSVRLRRTMQAA